MYRDKSLSGTPHLLILKALARGGEVGGYEIANWLEQICDEVLQVEEGPRG